MKHKVAELEGALLDYFVRLCDGSLERDYGPPVPTAADWSAYAAESGSESPAPLSGDEIEQLIERERIELRPLDAGGWGAIVRAPGGKFGSIWMEGVAPRVAAMRAYVASHFESEIELN